MSSIRRLGLASSVALLLCSPLALAGNVTLPNTFTAHTPAVATQVNANFGAVATSVNGNAGDIAALQAALTSVQSQLTAQQTTINTLNSTVAGQQTTITTLNSTVAGQQTAITTLSNTVTEQQTTINTLARQMAAVQGSSVMALAANLDLVNVPDPNTPAILYPTAQFHGINVQIVNGMGDEETVNGLGNLTVGYNPVDLTEGRFCSKGQYIDQTSCQTNDGTWASGQRSGSHNLIVGAYNSYSQYGGVLAGAYNIVNGVYASINGGKSNNASAYGSSVSGGNSNRASGTQSSISGGFGNDAIGNESSVSGGVVNTANSVYSSVSGGYNNTVTGYASSVSGGYSRSVTGNYNWRAGSLLELQ